MGIRVKHRKIFYVPGMVSLIMIPLCFLSYFYLNKSFVNLGAIDLGLPDKEGVFSITKDNPILNKTYKEFKFNGSLNEDGAILDSFQKSLRHQNKVKDTVNGIKLCFGKKMKYEVFIRILEVLVQENTPTYIPYENQMLIANGSKSDIAWYEKKLEKQNIKFGHSINCGTQDLMYAQTKRDREYREAMERENSMKLFYKNHWYLFVAFGLIIIANIFTLIKFNKNRIYNQKSYI